jgi:hypothetical protein
MKPYSAGEIKVTSVQADLDGQMVDYAAKGTKVELAGMEQVEGQGAWMAQTIPWRFICATSGPWTGSRFLLFGDESTPGRQDRAGLAGSRPSAGKNHDRTDVGEIPSSMNRSLRNRKSASQQIPTKESRNAALACVPVQRQVHACLIYFAETRIDRR